MATESQKPIHSVVLDAGAIIKNEPPVSTLLKRCESLISVPAVVSEIKDPATRSRFETTLKPFLTLREPNPTSLKFVTDFARRTGDLSVLSKPDLQIIALTYEIECQRNGGDWRLRSIPGQKGLNGTPPAKAPAQDSDQNDSPAADLVTSSTPTGSGETSPDGIDDCDEVTDNARADVLPPSGIADVTTEVDEDNLPLDDGLASDLEGIVLNTEKRANDQQSEIKVDSAQNSAESEADSESDSEGWITPSNLKKKQAEDAGSSTTQAKEPKVMHAAVLTTDFAMQNVILQMNLNLLSPSLTRVKHLKTFVLRCHACFQVTKDMSKQFCPKCGQPSLTRVSCSTNANGEFKLHLKKNMQWNHRGDRYSIPKPVHGSANGRIKGGGKGGWGSELMLAEDQKEYQRAVKDEKKQKMRNLMDEDYLPGILTGDRGRAGGRVKVGAGRNVNSKKR